MTPSMAGPLQNKMVMWFQKIDIASMTILWFFEPKNSNQNILTKNFMAKLNIAYKVEPISSHFIKYNIYD